MKNLRPFPPSFWRALAVILAGVISTSAATFTSNTTIGFFDATYDGQDIIASLTASAANIHGVIEGTFVAPADLPVGAKEVIFVGDQGSRGTAVFTSSATLRTIRRTVRRSVPVDPQAQTITMADDHMVSAADLWIVNKGSRDIVL